jgi:hypothetical protein
MREWNFISKIRDNKLLKSFCSVWAQSKRVSTRFSLLLLHTSLKKEKTKQKMFPEGASYCGIPQILRGWMMTARNSSEWLGTREKLGIWFSCTWLLSARGLQIFLGCQRLSSKLPYMCSHGNQIKFKLLSRTSSFLFLFFLQYWGLNSGPTPLATLPAFFCDGFFQDRVSWTSCPGWLQTVILLISASWVARITGVSHQLPAEHLPYNVKKLIENSVLGTLKY